MDDVLGVGSLFGSFLRAGDGMDRSCQGVAGEDEGDAQDATERNVPERDHRLFVAEQFEGLPAE
jgi:hypothetical protein